MSAKTAEIIDSCLTALAQNRRVMILVVLLGIVARLAAATRGHNYDVDSYLIVADIVKRGGSVYAETSRYNYGPVWFHLLHWLRAATAWIPDVDPVLAFRYALTLLLTLADLVIFRILRSRYNGITATIFFLNPVSVIITGYHSQFDNLALLLGMIAVLLLEDDPEAASPRRRITALLLLGLSLATKHILFVFPLWLAVKYRDRTWKLLCLALPVLLFLLSFVPYLPKGEHGILANVFLYSSWTHSIFYELLVPQLFKFVLSAKAVWIGVLIAAALFCRKQPPFESLLIYSILLVATSPATTNQYLAIVMPAIAVFPNLLFGLYTAVGSWHLLGDSSGLGIKGLRFSFEGESLTYYSIMMLLLCAGMAWSLWREAILSGRKAFYQIIFDQLGIQPKR